MNDGAKPAFPAMSIEQAHALLTAPGTPLEVGEEEVRGIRMKVWKNAPSTLREIYALGAMFGARDHLVFEDERATVAAFQAAANTFAHQLIADDVKPGDRVAVIMRNLPEWPVAFWGAVLAGAIVTPLNAWWTGSELEYGLKNWMFWGNGSSQRTGDYKAGGDFGTVRNTFTRNTTGDGGFGYFAKKGVL